MTIGTVVVADLLARVTAEDPATIMIDVEQQKLAGKSGDSVDFAVGESCFDDDVLTVNPAEFGHCLAKGNEHVPAGDRAVEHQISDPGQFRRLLGLRGERCGKKCPDGYQEIPALGRGPCFPFPPKGRQQVYACVLRGDAAIERPLSATSLYDGNWRRIQPVNATA
jgi:hypothetical protein